jgi:HEAT repeat protein
MLANRKYRRVVWFLLVIMGAILFHGTADTFAGASYKQDRPTPTSLTPVQLEIEKQRTRLSAADIEERRDALARLGSMHNPEASRVALSALRDSQAILRASAAAAVMSLPPDEIAANLIPLLNDKDEFVRREIAYALGKTHSRTAVPPLSERLLNDKIDSVRGAAAVALGEIGDETAVSSLAAVLNPQIGLSSKRSKKRKGPENPFVLRSAARSLGQIGSRAGLPALINAIQDEQGEADVRRESAVALGTVGDSSALQALRQALTDTDPYLSQAAHEAIRKILRSNSQ